MSEARAVADVEQGLVLASVEIAAPPERVFDALVKADDVLHWWGSDDTYRTTEWEADVRPGGAWRAGGRMPNGSTFAVHGKFLEVAQPHRLVLTWRPDWDGENETRITYLLEPIETGTRLTVRHEGFADRVAVCRSHGDGWRYVLGWLDAYLRPSAPPSHYFLFRLLPPRPTFMQDMTPEELALMQAHGQYWRGHLATGKMLIFGPVVDANGGFGVGILRLSGPAEAGELTSNDPVILSNQGFRVEILPMPRAVHG